MDLKNIIFSKETYSLLKINGAMDRAAGIDRDTGWQNLAANIGYEPHKRTPAQEAYLDGYYAPTPGDK